MIHNFQPVFFVFFIWLYEKSCTFAFIIHKTVTKWTIQVLHFLSGFTFTLVGKGRILYAKTKRYNISK